MDRQEPRYQGIMEQIDKQGRAMAPAQVAGRRAAEAARF
jgi:hypothetical protein